MSSVNPSTTVVFGACTGLFMTTLKTRGAAPSRVGLIAINNESHNHNAYNAWFDNDSGYHADYDTSDECSPSRCDGLPRRRRRRRRKRS